jgi:hypothetical protein
MDCHFIFFQVTSIPRRIYSHFRFSKKNSKFFNASFTWGSCNAIKKRTSLWTQAFPILGNLVDVHWLQINLYAVVFLNNFTFYGLNPDRAVFKIYFNIKMVPYIPPSSSLVMPWRVSCLVNKGVFMI